VKNILCSLALLLSTLAAFSQSQKITIFCTLDWHGRVDYNRLDKLLPDSLKGKILFDYAKEYDLNSPIDALLMMSLDGWKLASTGSVYKGNKGEWHNSFYILAREIALDDAGMKLYADNLKSLEVKR
jgi:hypothetical protein